ncbi:glycerophosphodiester phosphodiesterase [Halorientalis sp. IM1011]|uniref:glycerophosphodiester phosphodiesterase n=1 Tax=Halorientalis sp. IM1011 TaxID=1932360 RepID=UPI00097CD636|nr:glycerophosphodiester phosphodiesterase [Halorientalis sp. IM1011]AQL43623.1 glycerophosphodiester phosphodiesterase [Halorientalis sp. IM1011]
MEIIGHRGCADQCPENTVAAVERAGRYVDAVEVDVRRCGSGELVVFHDEYVDELTDGTGRVADLTLAELRALDVAGSGEPIPRLGAVLDAVPPGVGAQLELKETGLAADVREVLADHSVDAAISSFQPAALESVLNLDWSVQTGYLFAEDPTANLQTAVEMGCDAVHPHYDLCIDTDVVERAHGQGLNVIAWKAAKTSEEIADLRAAGVDGVTADRWDIA